MIENSNEETLDYLADLIKEKVKNSKDKFIIFVDGVSGGGKSTLCKKLLKKLKDCNYFNLDAYATRSGDFFSAEMIKINHQFDFENTEYQVFQIKQEIKDSRHKIQILEGAFCFKNLEGIKPCLKIYINLNLETSAKRLNDREIQERTDIDPEVIYNSTKQWQKSETKYLKTFNPIGRADIVINTEDGYKIIKSNIRPLS